MPSPKALLKLILASNTILRESEKYYKCYDINVIILRKM